MLSRAVTPAVRVAARSPVTAAPLLGAAFSTSSGERRMFGADIPEFKRWPVKKFNTVVNICDVGEVHIIERLGKLHAVRQPGI